MLYVAYVALVATLNVFIGFALAWVFTESQAQCSSGVCGRRRNAGERDITLPYEAHLGAQPDLLPIIESLGETRAKLSSSHQAPVPAAASGRREIEIDGSWTGIATLALDHSEKFQNALQCILTRAESGNHPRTADELQQLAQAAHSEASTWLVDAEYVASHLPVSLKDTPNGKAVADRCERIINDQLAQTETSLSNLSMTEWKAGSASDDNRLALELKRLIESCNDMQSKVQAVIEFVYQSQLNPS